MSYTLNHVSFQQQEVEPEFSLNTLQEFVGDDKLALDSILQSFVADGTAQAEALNLAIKDGNWQEVVRTAHKLLPLVKMLGQPKLSELLSMLDSDRTDFDKHEIVNLALIKLQDLTGAIAKYLKTK